MHLYTYVASRLIDWLVDWYLLVNWLFFSAIDWLIDWSIVLFSVDCRMWRSFCIGLWLYFRMSVFYCLQEIHANIQMMKQKQENGRRLEAKRLAEIAGGETAGQLQAHDPTTVGMARFVFPLISRCFRIFILFVLTFFAVPFPQYQEFSENSPVDAVKGGRPVRDHSIRWFSVSYGQ